VRRSCRAPTRRQPRSSGYRGRSARGRPKRRLATVLATQTRHHRVRHLRIALGGPCSRWFLSFALGIPRYLPLFVHICPDFRQIWSCVGAVACRHGLRTAGTGRISLRYGTASIRDGGASCRCCLRLSMLILCVLASRAVAGGFQRSGRLHELLRRNNGSSEGVTRMGVLKGGTGLENVVSLYTFVRLRLLGSRKARPAHAS
jgi:hypothetical protein